MTIVFQAAFGDVREDCKEWMQSIKERCRKEGWEYNLITRPKLSSPRQAQIESDELRFEILSTVDGAIWADWDVALEKAFKHVEGGRPYMSHRPPRPAREVLEHPDPCLCWGPTSFYEKILKKAETEGMLSVFCWPTMLLRQFQGEMEVIPFDWFTHRGITGPGIMPSIKRKREKRSCKGISIPPQTLEG